MLPLKEKITVITGGSRGLGKALAYTLAKEGAIVAMCALEKTELKKVCDEIKKQDGSCGYSRVDVTKKTQVEKFIETILKKYKRIDVMINNAGWAGMPTPIQKTTDTEFNKYFNTNVTSAFYFMRAVLPIMEKQKEGMIINITSRAGSIAHPRLPIYSATKFALRALTSSLGKSLQDAHSPIQCISVAPGGMNTPMRAALFGKEDAQKQKSPESVAEIIKDVITKKTFVPNGGEVVIQNGKIVSREDPS